jgi:DNA-binding response OmpR family regulator
MHALIIEEDTWIAMMIEDALSAIGYISFDFAFSPETAIAAGHRRCPDLITSDIRLGAGRAIDAIRQICSAKAIATVFITATPWEVRAIDSSAIVVPKPFAPGALKQGVARANEVLAA